jgi:hypothetical protein
VIRRRVCRPLSPHFVLNLEYRKSQRFFCISWNCDGCFLSGFLSGTLLAQKHHNFAGLNIDSHGKRAWATVHVSSIGLVCSLIGCREEKM